MLVVKFTGFFLYIITFSRQHQQKNCYQFFYCDLWKVSFIVHYQSDCIPKSNSKQETLQTIYSNMYFSLYSMSLLLLFFLCIATKNVLFLFCLHNTAQIFLANSSLVLRDTISRIWARFFLFSAVKIHQKEEILSIATVTPHSIRLRTASFFIHTRPCQPPALILWPVSEYSLA